MTEATRPISPFGSQPYERDALYPSLFDDLQPARPEADVLDAQARITAARVARDAGMQQAADGLTHWLVYAREYLLAYLRHHPTMFTDDLWGLDPPLREPPVTAEGKPRRRALGPVVLKLVREGAIVKSGRVRPRTFGHAADGPVWQSLIYGQERP